MSTKKDFVADAFFMFFGSASGALANLIIGMILVRHFVDKNVYATYSQSMFLADTLVAFVPLGMHRAIIYFFPRVESKRAFTFQTIMITTLLILIFGITFVLLRDRIGLWFNNPELSAGIPIILGIIWTLNFHSILLQILVATYRATLAGVMLFAFNIVYIASVAVGVAYDCNVQQILLIILANHMIKTVVTFAFVFGLPGNLADIKKFEHLWAQIKYSLPLGLSSFTGMLSKTADRFIIMTIFSPAIYAIYDRGAITIPFIEHVPYSISNVIQPDLTQYYKEGKIDDFIHLWHESITKAAKVMFPMMIFAWVAAKHIIIFVSTDAYLNSVQYFRIYLFLLLFNLTLYPAILMAIGHTVKILKVSIIYVLINVSIGILLVVVIGLGPIGPAIATVLTEFVRMMVYLFSISRSLHVNFFAVYPWKKLAGTLLTAFPCGIILYPLAQYKLHFFKSAVIDFNSLVTVMIMGIIFFTLFVLIGLKFKTITPGEIKAVRDIFRRG